MNKTIRMSKREYNYEKETRVNNNMRMSKEWIQLWEWIKSK